MRASALEFRLRIFIHAVLYVVAFTVPWNYFFHIDNGQSLWLPGAVYLERSGIMGLTAASNALLIAGILLALAAAGLRTWAAAYLHAAVVFSPAMQAGAVVSDGPYRYLRNPLYLGTWIQTFALALLMPPSGAIFAIFAIGFEQLRLIGGEETYLTVNLGESYLKYKSFVPSILPSLRPRTPGLGVKPQWLSAVLGESYMWGVAIAFATVGWRYNAALVTQGVLIALGVSLVVRGFISKPALQSSRR